MDGWCCCCCWLNRAPCVCGAPSPFAWLSSSHSLSLERYGLYDDYYTTTTTTTHFLISFFDRNVGGSFFFLSVLCVVTIFEMEMIFRPQHFLRNETRLVYIVYFELRFIFSVCYDILQPPWFFSVLFSSSSSPFSDFFPDFSLFFLSLTPSIIHYSSPNEMSMTWFWRYNCLVSYWDFFDPSLCFSSLSP